MVRDIVVCPASGTGTATIVGKAALARHAEVSTVDSGLFTGTGSSRWTSPRQPTR
ncbi:hypothetical protein [Amycolatopsis japonica]